MYRSYSYNNMPHPTDTFTVRDEHPLPRPTQPKREIKEIENEKPLQQSSFLNLEKDDLLLMAIIAALILNKCDDKLLLLALAYILLSG